MDNCVIPPQQIHHPPSNFRTKWKLFLKKCKVDNLKYHWKWKIIAPFEGEILSLGRNYVTMRIGVEKNTA